MRFAIGLGVAGLAALVVAIASGRFEGDPSPTTTGESSAAVAPELQVPAVHETLELASRARVPVLDSPNGDRLGTAQAKTESGERTVLSVADRRGEWIGVESALSGVEPVAWVREQRKRMIPSETEWALVLDRAEGAGELRRGEKAIEEFEFSEEGQAGAVRPGRYAIADRLEGELVLTATPDPGVPGAPPGPPVHIASDPVAETAIRVDASALKPLYDQSPIGAPVYIEGQ
jgi:hypothetical protein